MDFNIKIDRIDPAIQNCNAWKNASEAINEFV